MIGKSASLSSQAVDWVEKIGGLTKKNFSQALDVIILEHKEMFPAVKRQVNLNNMRAAAAILCHECGIEQEAIIAWIKEATTANK